MKKSFLTISTFLFALVGLAACDGGKTSTSTSTPTSDKPASTQTVDVPTAEGKLTYYFTLGLGDGKVNPADSSYVSVYMTGPMINWATGLDALVFTKMENSNVYYTQIDTPADANTLINPDSQHMDYQIVLGYNESSNMAAGKLGLQWVNEYKADQETSGVANPYYEWNGTSNKVDLGTQTFSTAVAAPDTPCEFVVFKVELAEALPEGYYIAIAGSMNGWDTALPAKEYAMEPNADRTVWTKRFDGLYAGNYEFQILAQPVVSEEEEATATLNWDGKCEQNVALDGNLTIEVIKDLHDGKELDIMSGEKVTFAETVFTPETPTPAPETPETPAE